ncbi:MAG: HAD family hydrolase [Methanobacteriaceae archaeon]|nr:MAG: cation transporter [Methanobacterium sp. BRmetb2]MCC7557163.1 HAD family hydrolase [Methanobacteriaceae archaeon]
MTPKAVVFDNSGTLIERYRALKNIKNGQICDYVSSIDVVDYDSKRALVVLQTDPSKCIINAIPTQTIYQFITRNNIKFDVSYSAADIKKDSVLKAIKDDKTTVQDVKDTINAVIEKKFNVQICSGSGFIVNIKKGKIEFTITAGGKLFPEVTDVIRRLETRGIDIYVASGDRKKSLEELARFIDIPLENVFSTADSRRKKEIVRELKKKYKVMMVGNSANDILALEEADIGVLTLQQEENTPQKVFDAADVVVNNIKEVLDIDF